MHADRLPVIVIGLPRRSDRRALIGAMLSRVSAVTPLFAADVGAVVDWRDWTDAAIDRLRARAFPWCDARSPNPWWNRHLKLGEAACTLSHWNVWTFAVAHNLGDIIVLEDDARLESEFDDVGAWLDRLDEHDPHWDLFYLGRGRRRPDRGQSGVFALPGFSSCTYGYAVSPRGLAKMLATDLANAIIPVDEFLPAMFMDHPRQDVRARFPPVMAAYGLFDDIVRQQPKQHWGSDTEESPFLVRH